MIPAVIDPLTGAVNGILPKRLLQPGEVVEVPSSGKAPYKVKRLAGRDEYRCTCPTYQCGGAGGTLVTSPNAPRTCRHLKDLLGEVYEEARVKLPLQLTMSPQKPGATSQASSSSSTLLAAKRKRVASPPAANRSSSSSGSSSAPFPTVGPIEVMLAHTFDLKGSKSPVGMWASEKLDGVRAYWDGKSLWSRNQKEYLAPDWWAKRLPKNVCLDGELFIKRDYFDTTSGEVRGGGDWSKMSYAVFDVVDFEKTLEERWAVARKVCVDGEMSVDQLIKRGRPCIAFLEQVKITSMEQMEGMLANVESLGGEGLMLRRSASYYKKGRSNDVLKVKTFYDAEGTVIGYKAGTGRNEGRVGAIKVEMACGLVFDCGTGLSDHDREYPPPLGSIVKYSFQELYPSGAPRFPAYKGIAIDKDEPRDAVVRSAAIRAAAAAKKGEGGAIVIQ